MPSPSLPPTQTILSSWSSLHLSTSPVRDIIIIQTELQHCNTSPSPLALTSHQTNHYRGHLSRIITVPYRIQSWVIFPGGVWCCYSYTSFTELTVLQYWGYPGVKVCPVWSGPAWPSIRGRNSSLPSLGLAGWLLTAGITGPASAQLRSRVWGNI